MFENSWLDAHQRPGESAEGRPRLCALIALKASSAVGPETERLSPPTPSKFCWQWLGPLHPSSSLRKMQANF